jgi:RNA polymerase sigma-70 factor (ECF subfamily)
VEEIVGRLPRKLHEVVILSYLREWSHAEISEVLGIPEGTVKSRLFLARVRIRKEAKRRGILEKGDDGPRTTDHG